MVDPHGNIVPFPARYRASCIHPGSHCQPSAHAALRLALLHRFVTRVEVLAPPLDDEAERRKACRRVRMMLDEVRLLQDMARAWAGKGNDE